MRSTMSRVGAAALRRSTSRRIGVRFAKNGLRAGLPVLERIRIANRERQECIQFFCNGDGPLHRRTAHAKQEAW